METLNQNNTSEPVIEISECLSETLRDAKEKGIIKENEFVYDKNLLPYVKQVCDNIYNNYRPLLQKDFYNINGLTGIYFRAGVESIYVDEYDRLPYIFNDEKIKELEDYKLFEEKYVYLKEIEYVDAQCYLVNTSHILNNQDSTTLYDDIQKLGKDLFLLGMTIALQNDLEGKEYWNYDKITPKIKKQNEIQNSIPPKENINNKTDFKKFFSKLFGKKDYTPRYNGEIIDIPLSTGNGIGLTLLGDFRSDVFHGEETHVSYHFFVFFYFPIFPLGCYRVHEGAVTRSSYKRSSTSYKIFGTERWMLKEILNIYGRGILVLALFALIITILEAIFD